MDRFARGFVFCSLLYLVVGGALGTWMVHFPESRGWYRWSHLHIMVLGFVTMMIFGVAYHVLPRFSGNVVYSPLAGWIHLFCANLGLWGMATSWVMHARSGFSPDSSWFRALTISADVQYAGMLLFVWNMVMSLRHRPKPAWLPPAALAVHPQGAAR